MEYRFEWDARQATANLRKHRVSFEEAVTAFGDPFAVLMPDPDHSTDESRYLLLGATRRHNLLVVSFVDRFAATRLISARRANRSERRNYEEDQAS